MKRNLNLLDFCSIPVLQAGREDDRELEMSPNGVDAK
jgi:hypothetical protein